MNRFKMRINRFIYLILRLLRHYEIMNELNNKTILIVEDDPLQSSMLAILLQRKLNCASQICNSAQDAIDYLNNKKAIHVDAIVMDMHMPGMTGLEALKIIHKRWPQLPVIFLTGANNTETAVEVMKHGAFDFVSKPYDSGRIIITVRNALQAGELAAKAGRLKWTGNSKLQFTDLIGHDKGLHDSITMGRKIAASDIPVLIMGETGVGKEVFARALHGESNRHNKPFIAINCAAIPEQLIESILFGHEKGSFTGATEKTAGKFREAEGGTIFLDEIGEMPAAAQTKLLRVLQQKEVEPVGATQAVPVNVRIVSATNRDLAHEVSAGRFREDLFFRLNVVPLTLPPLRQRRDDILLLAKHFIERFSADEHRIAKTITPEAEQQLINHRWPGNVRELENCLRRALVLSETSELSSQDFNLNQNTGTYTAIDSLHTIQNYSAATITINLLDNAQNFKGLASLEKEIIEKSLQHFDQNITAAAKALGIGKSTLYRKINETDNDTGMNTPT